jgi:glycosyltransferase involved in cell wall biosynthesis
MSACDEPLVSVVTPVYNGAAYLAECIESVIKQTYSNWEYIIVNNCSKDATPEIARKYARINNRIRVYDNDILVDIITNHNRAFSLICPTSKYCKVVSADDWLFPECITRMVHLAEANSSVGIVSAYQLSGGASTWYVRTDGLPYHSSVVSGREISRASLLGTLDVLGNPTSNLYRADLIRTSGCFYPNSTAEADISACFESFKTTDFGFVHQVLSYERLHQEQITKTSKDLNAYLSSKIGDLHTYGSLYLAKDELGIRLRQLMDEYYSFLAISAVNGREKRFWQYHKRRLNELGYELDYVRMGMAISAKVIDLMLNPKQTAEKIFRRATAKWSARSVCSAARVPAAR